MRHPFVVLLIVSACGGTPSEAAPGSPSATAPTPSPTASAKTPATPPTPSTKTPATPPKATPAGTPPGAPPKTAPSSGVPAVTLRVGEPTLGCFAWSASLHAAACVAGSRSTSGTDLTLAYLGSESASVPLGETVEAATADTVNADLAREGYVALAGVASPLSAGSSVELSGVTVAFTSKETDPGGENIAPTNHNRVTIRCRDAERTVFDDEAEGHTASVATRVIDGRVLVLVTTAIALEGEYGEAFTGIAVDPATCASAST